MAAGPFKKAAAAMLNFKLLSQPTNVIRSTEAVIAVDLQLTQVNFEFRWKEKNWSNGLPFEFHNTDVARET